MIIDEINIIVSEYLGFHKGYNNVNELMDLRKRLTGYYLNYANELGELKKQWCAAQSIRENKRAKIEFENISTPSKATIIAKANTQKELSIEKQAEGRYYDHKGNMEAISEILSSMNQHIAQARDEWKLQNFLKSVES